MWHTPEYEVRLWDLAEKFCDHLREDAFVSPAQMCGYLGLRVESALYRDLKHFLGVQGVAARFKTSFEFNHRLNCWQLINSGNARDHAQAIVNVSRRAVADARAEQARTLDPDPHAPEFARLFHEGRTEELQGRLKQQEAALQMMNGGNTPAALAR